MDVIEVFGKIKKIIVGGGSGGEEVRWGGSDW